MNNALRSGVARHHQIAQVLKARLESGKWAADNAPATELGLCAEFGASRTTVRQALSELKIAGLLESRAGVGTRGVRRPVTRKLVRANGDPLHAGLNSLPRVVSMGEVDCPPVAAAFFRIATGSPIWHFIRVNTLDDRPLSVVDSYLPAHLGKAFSRTDLERPMHQLLWERFGMRLHRSVHAIRVARADVDISHLLGVALADPVMRIQSSVSLADGAPIRWTENHFREDAYEYLAEMEWPDPPGTARPAPPLRARSAQRTKASR